MSESFTTASALDVSAPADVSLARAPHETEPPFSALKGETAMEAGIRSRSQRLSPALKLSFTLT
jgi:hypothetical protein